MKIFITGGAGFLGSNLVSHFLKKNNNTVCVIDNYSTSSKFTLNKHKNLKIIEGDIKNKNLLKKIFSDFRPDIIFHLAASYQDPNNFTEDCNTNIIGTCNLIELCLKYKVSRVINFQTILCYGEPINFPIKENHPINPKNSYSITKSAGESFLLNSDLSVISLRISIVIGPRLAIGPIPTFYKRLKSGLACFCTDTYRDFLDIEDFLELIDLIIINQNLTGVFNVASGETHSVKEIFDLVCKHLNVWVDDVELISAGKDDVKNMYLDISKISKKLNWKPKHNFEETINKQLIWYDNNGVDKLYSHLKNNVKND